MPPRLARLLAALVAIALVAGALALRGAIAGDDEDTADDQVDMPTEVDTDGPPASAFRLACDEDLGSVCDALGVDPVRASTMLTDAVEGDLPYDAWLTLDGMEGVLRSTLIEEGLDPVTTGRVEVASSPLALLALEDPPGGCDDEGSVDWTCLMDPPEPFANGVAIPDADTSLGTLAIAAAARALQDTADFGRGAYEGTPEADTVIALLEDSPTTAGSTTDAQVSAMFTSGRADAAVTIAGLAEDRADRVQGRNRGLRVVPLSPEVVVGVVLVGLGPDGEDAVRALGPVVTGQTGRDALTAAGWAGGADPTSGLPAADVIYGVREELGR